MKKNALIGAGSIVVAVIVIVILSQRTTNPTSKAPPPTGTNSQTQENANPQTPKTTTNPSAQGETVPDFHLVNYRGETVNLSDFRGKPLVINSWAAWCPFCRKELPDFVTVQKEFGDRVVIIAIDRGEPLATAKQYSDSLGVTGSLVFLLDPNDSFYQAIGGFSMPETLFVNSDGAVVLHKRGPMDAAEIKQHIEAML